MSQVNLLSVDVGQNPDMQGSKGETPIKIQAKTSAFSDAMEQHYPRRNLAESDNNTKQGGNFASKAAEQHQELIKNDGSLTQVKATKADDAHTLPVPLPIDDESLIIKPEVGSDYILPLTVSPNTEQLIIAAKSKDDAHITPVPTPPLQVENKELKQVEGALKGDSAIPNNYKQSYLDFQSQKSQPKIGSTDNIANDDTVDLLKMLKGAQQLLTESAPELSKNQIAEQSQLAKNAQGEQMQTSSNTSEAQQAQLLTGSKNTAKQFAENATADLAKITPVNLAESISASDAKPITLKEAGTISLASEQGIVNDVDLIAKQENIQTLAQEANAALDKNEKAKQVSVNRELQDSVSVSDSDSDSYSEPDLAKANKALSPELNAVHKSGVAESNETKVQAAELKQANVAEFKRVSENEPTQARVVNQSTAAAITMLTADAKADANQKAAVNEDVSKLANAMGEEQKSTKTEGEKQLPQADKVISAFNQTLDAQAAKPTASSAEIAAQQEQRFESTINQLTTNTVQTQKSITAMNIDTIAIYRKDFANAVKDKVMVMINQKIQQVEIKLDPPEMGNIHVRVNLQNEQAAVQFVVQNQQAKEALEQNMGKLRDMLAESGVDVGEASIEQRQAKEQNGNGFDQQTNNGQNAESTEDNFNENDNSMVNVVKASSTGIDYYV